jgi:hypothetical protein
MAKKSKKAEPLKSDIPFDEIMRRISKIKPVKKKLKRK